MLNSEHVIRIEAALIMIAVVLALACTSRRTEASNREAAKSTSGHSVTLTWQGTPGTKYYCIYRSTISKSGYQKIGTSPTPTYKDAPVPSGSTFYYVVTAVNDKGESKYSNEIKATVP